MSGRGCKLAGVRSSSHACAARLCWPQGRKVLRLTLSDGWGQLGSGGDGLLARWLPLLQPLRQWRIAPAARF